MNKIYRLVWNAARRAWVVTGELTRAHKKTVTVSALVLCSSAVSNIAMAVPAPSPKYFFEEDDWSKKIMLSGDGTTVILGTRDGQRGFEPSSIMGTTRGKDTYIIRTSDGTPPEQNKIAVSAGSVITGGHAFTFAYASVPRPPEYEKVHADGGDGISVNNFSLENSGTVRGGYSGICIDASGDCIGPSSTGGVGIRGNNLIITNMANAEISGGDGLIYDSFFFNNTSNSGGAGISGNFLTIINQSGAVIKGGDVGVYYIIESNGGDAITGSHLSVINSGVLNGGFGYEGVIWGAAVDGASLRTLGGANFLTINAGSDIQGDIVLATPVAGENNTLAIVSNAATTIRGAPYIDGTDVGNKGNLIAGAGTGVMLSGERLTFTGAATFGDNSSLTFMEGSSLKTDSAAFTNTRLSTVVTDWNLNDILLLTTDNGITGTFDPEVYNPLLTEGAKDYAGILLSADGKDLMYSLKWNSRHGDGYGTFDLKTGAALNIDVALQDNTAGNSHGWDGRSLTKAGQGTLSLSEQNTYTGSTTVSDGMLTLATADAIAQNSGVTVAQAGVLNLNGNSQTLARTENRGTVLVNDAGAGILTQPVTVTGDMVNRGLLVIDNCSSCTGQTYVQAGNWTGDNGTVSMSVVAGGDDSPADRLVITGPGGGRQL